MWSNLCSSTIVCFLHTSVFWGPYLLTNLEIPHTGSSPHHIKTLHANDSSAVSHWNKSISSMKHVYVMVSAAANPHKSRLFIFLQLADLLSVMPKLYEIHQPQTTTEQKDIKRPIRAKRATWIKCLMRYEVDSRREAALLSLPGVLQITDPEPGTLASHWLRQVYLPNKACLIGPWETMACVNSPGALDSQPTQQSLC